MKKLNIVLAVALGLLTVGAIAQTVYTYKCPTCKAIYQYSQTGFYKCPKDGTALMRQLQ